MEERDKEPTVRGWRCGLRWRRPLLKARGRVCGTVPKVGVSCLAFTELGRGRLSTGSRSSMRGMRTGVHGRISAGEPRQQTHPRDCSLKSRASALGPCKAPSSKTPLRIKCPSKQKNTPQCVLHVRQSPAGNGSICQAFCFGPIHAVPVRSPDPKLTASWPHGVGKVHNTRPAGLAGWGYMPQASLVICSSCELPTIQQMGQTCYGMATSWRSWSWPASELFGLTVGGFRANHGVGKVWMDHTVNASSWGGSFCCFLRFCTAMMSGFMVSSSCSFNLQVLQCHLPF